MLPFEQKIIDLLGRNTRRPLNRREIVDRLRLRGNEHKQLTRILNQLVRNGQLQERKGRYRLTPQQQRTEGTFSQASKGFGFLRPDDPQAEDLFIPTRYIGSAMDGDRVQVSCRISTRDRRPYGQIIRILQRAHRRLIGHYQPQGKTGNVWPLEQKLGGPIRVANQSDIKPGDVVDVEIEHYASEQYPARGRIIDRLGATGDPQVDIETVIRTHDLPRRFSVAALGQAREILENVADGETADRVDLRPLPLVTIDGETAKDFDDAVALQVEPNGNYRLWVCIADVAHYVTPATPLDQDALDRGTSVYFPGFCLPMLPEALSNGICSLKPYEDRLVICAEIEFSPQGQRIKADFYPAVMCSRARLTYTQVTRCLESPQQSELNTDLTEQLQQMAQLAQQLTRMRHDRGSLDMDLPEVEIILDDQGAPCDLVKIERNQAHRLIEEFMLAANEAVADFLTHKGWPLLYRIHDEPAPLKLQDLQQLAARCGVGLALTGKPQQALQQLLVDIAEKPEARLINQQLLRSLKQACYTPENTGHFGLAADCYCHFTSPIRRYPDLVVHRVLKLALADKPKSMAVSKEKLQTLGHECSAKERRAMQAERSLIELRRCQLMTDRIGDEFTGCISSVTKFGFFVELDEIYIEGLVHITSLQGDYYHFDPTSQTLTGEHRRQQFRVGLQVKVRLAHVELWRRRIDFTLIEP